MIGITALGDSPETAAQAASGLQLDRPAPPPAPRLELDTPGAPGSPGDAPEPGGPEPGGPGPGGPNPGALRPPAACNGVPALTAAEAEALARAAAAAVDVPLTVAVVDRPGNLLALYRKGTTPAEDDRAVGLARASAFLSNDQAPLSSRTVRFISGVHFPPGVRRTPNAALYGIENTNRGCDLQVPFISGQEVPQALSVAGGICDAVFDSGCGAGLVTGKPQPTDGTPPGLVSGPDPTAVQVDPGGVPVFRGDGPGSLLGGIGVALADGLLGAERAEFAAVSALSALGFLPQPAAPGVIFIDGVRLPFVEQVNRPPGTAPDPALPGPLALPADNGACVPESYLVAARNPPAGSGGPLTAADAQRIVQQAAAAAARTRAVIRLPLGSRARMVFAVSDLDGEILALYRMPDATVFSIDVAVAKARNVVWYSTPAGKTVLPGLRADTAVSNRTVSFGAQPLFPVGIDGTAAGPFFNLFVDDWDHPCETGFAPGSMNRNGTVFFAGSIPLYAGGQLVGGLGVSGDGVEQDDYVSYQGAAGYRPPESLWANRDFIRGVRMPFLKFPRNPEG